MLNRSVGNSPQLKVHVLAYIHIQTANNCKRMLEAKLFRIESQMAFEESWPMKRQRALPSHKCILMY